MLLDYLMHMYIKASIILPLPNWYLHDLVHNLATGGWQAVIILATEEIEFIK